MIRRDFFKTAVAAVTAVMFHALLSPKKVVREIHGYLPRLRGWTGPHPSESMAWLDAGRYNHYVASLFSDDSVSIKFDQPPTVDEYLIAHDCAETWGLWSRTGRWTHDEA